MNLTSKKALLIKEKNKCCKIDSEMLNTEGMQAIEAEDMRTRKLGVTLNCLMQKARCLSDGAGAGLAW
jgi:hypothetical protein